MRIASLSVLLAAAASCGSSLGDPSSPNPAATTTLPEWNGADCTMFNPSACRLDVTKTSVGIDVHYPNVVFCRLQLLPTVDLPNAGAYDQLAASWQVSMGYGPSNQTIIAPEKPEWVLEYPLGSEALYLTRVTFMSKTSETLASLIATATGRTDVSLYAVPVECASHRPAP
jgi:hypothetical protein